MPLYIADFLADTAHLSAVQVGAYLLLIMVYWRRGNALPDDDRALAQVTRQTAHGWARLRPIMEPFFTVEGGVWLHKRIEFELKIARAFSAAASAKGKISGRVRKKKNQEDSGTGVHTVLNTVGNREGTGDEPRTNPSPSPSPSEDSVAKATGASAPPPPPAEPSLPLTNGHAEPELTEQDLIWRDGLTWLAQAEGKTVQPLRSMVGRWCKVYGNPRVLAAMTEARSQSPPVVGPVAWIEATLAERNRENAQSRRNQGAQPIRNGFIALGLEAKRRASKGS